MNLSEALEKTYQALTTQPLMDWHNGNVMAVAWGRDDQKSLPMSIFSIRTENEDTNHIQAILPAYITLHMVSTNHSDAIQKLEWAIGYLKKNMCDAITMVIDDGYDHELHGFVATAVLKVPVSLEEPPKLDTP